MTKLYTLEDLSAFSADAVYKIGLALEQYGLTEESMMSFEDYEGIFSKVLLDLEEGAHAIIAVETQQYNVVKRDILGRFIIEEAFSDDLSQIITVNAGDDVSEIDMSGHCMQPVNALVHVTTDGLYSGFTVDVLSGKLTLIPLDFLRIDGILESLTINVMEKLRGYEQGDTPYISMPDYDFLPAVGGMVSSLVQAEKTLALATSEATMWVYNLYDKVEALTQVVNFVEIIDQDNEEGETTAESESVRIIRHAREAMNNTGSDFGGAVSEIYSTENDEGNIVYFAYAAVADKYAAKAKKITTMNADDLAVILPHAVSVLTQIVGQKTQQSEPVAQPAEEKSSTAEKPEEKKLSKGMAVFAALVFLVAVIVPVYLVFGKGGNTPTESTTALTPDSTTAVTDVTSSQPVATTTPFSNQGGIPAINNNVQEPTVTDVSAYPTTTQVASTSGTFNFYVFGYGHGVGMSQVGANYLANNNWSWAEILAHYYYDPNTVIMTGDTYPATIKYDGTDYNTREFLASALESEMGPSFHMEALKAQVVAIYTFAKYNNFNLTTTSTAFGKTPSAQCYAAVDEIMGNGVYVSHNGATACTAYHAMSAGITTSYYNVWGKNSGTQISYLSGGRKSYGDYEDPDFKQLYTISSDELKAVIKNATGTEPSGDPATWVSIVTHDSCINENIGYVSTINVNGKIYTGNDFRTDIMGGNLRSHCFTIEYVPTAVATTNTTP